MISFAPYLSEIIKAHNEHIRGREDMVGCMSPVVLRKEREKNRQWWFAGLSCFEGIGTPENKKSDLHIQDVLFIQ